MVRILSIWLPQLPLDRWVRRSDPRLEGPFAITTDIKNASRISHLNEAAKKAGLDVGLSIPDARAICPDLLTEPSDTLRETVLLRALWRWADVLSPRVALDAPDGLLLDISGCAHLFGGERSIAYEACERLTDMQIISRLGIADTKRGAQALARFGNDNINIAAPGMTSSALRGLPMAALGLKEKTLNELIRSGLTHIGQLYEIRSGELARRFGLELTTAVETSRGQAPDPVTPAAADPVYAARMSLPEPVGYVSDIEDIVRRLGEVICQRLKNDRKGARRFELIVRCVDTGDHVLSVGFARPCFETGPVLQQLARPLDELKIEFGADWFRLCAKSIEPVREKQTLLGGKTEKEDQFARVVSTLGNRIGFDNIRHFVPGNSHLPEHEFGQAETIDRRGETRWQDTPRERPIRLFRRPERLHTIEPGRPPITFEWRKQHYVTQSANGPERLTAEWWRGFDNRTRDYWRVQTEQGPRLWLLTYPGQTDSDWFIAGRFP